MRKVPFPNGFRDFMVAKNHLSQIIGVSYSSTTVTKDFEKAVVRMKKKFHTEKKSRKFEPIYLHSLLL